jgi:hypothetical protein
MDQPGSRSPMSDANRPWPPLVIAEHVPRLIKWRDVLITLIMWLCLALLLATEFELFVGSYLEQLGFGFFNTNANWRFFFEQLTPYILVTAALAIVLVLFSLQTLRRRSRALSLPQPPPLEVADEARLARLDEIALIAARDRPIVIVHIDADGSHRIAEP